jgi:uncharacterized OB-fold protein
LGVCSIYCEEDINHYGSFQPLASKTTTLRTICPDCGEEAKKLYQFSGRGEVYSYTTLIDAPEGHQEQAPYTVAIVKLEEGPLVTAQLTDLDQRDVNVGMPVEMVTRKLRAEGDRGMIVYGYKFRPMLAAA